MICCGEYLITYVWCVLACHFYIELSVHIVDQYIVMNMYMQCSVLLDAIRVTPCHGQSLTDHAIHSVSDDLASPGLGPNHIINIKERGPG